MLLLLAACGSEPDPCDPMCQAAAELYGGCLADWGADWPAAGYADEGAFLESCATWAWEMREMGHDVDATCAEREALFRDGTCEDFSGIDWSEPP